MVVCKCSFHTGKRYSVKHNLREYDREKWNKDAHISEDRKFQNDVLVNRDLRQVFDEKFGDALTEMNEKNVGKHSDRLIGFKDKSDYEKCPDEQKRERAVAAYFKEQKKAVQECIVQLGDHATYEKIVAEIGRGKADAMYSEYLDKAFEHFKEQNPSLEVFCAVKHMDEVKDGTPHLHIDFIPVAQSDRGMTCKVSMDGALKQLGFKREKEQKYAETPYKQWLKDRRKGFEDFAQTYCNNNDYNEHNRLGIVIAPSEKSQSRHEQPQVWRERQERVKATQSRIDLFHGKEKKMQLEAAEFILSNSQAIAEGIEATAANKVKEAENEWTAANKVKNVCFQAKDEYERQTERAREREKQAEKARISAENELKQVKQTVRDTVNQTLAHSERLQRLKQETDERRQRQIQLGVREDASSNRTPESMEIKQDQSLRTNRQQGVKR